MNKETYIRITKSKLNKLSADIMIKQIEKYDEAKSFKLAKHNYKVGDEVILKKGTLLHGTYKNIEGLKEIVKDGLISSWFIEGRGTKYPSSVGVWNLKKEYQLKEYINFYSGGTVKYFNQPDNNKETEVISFSDISTLMNKVIEKGYLAWQMEQTKEARFMPSLVQDKVQIGIIFNGDNKYTKELLKGDILQYENINDVEVKEFVNPNYYERFLIDRKNKDDFFTDRESAILFGLPANLIEGILVGREYEKDQSKLNEIKKLLPNAYIWNLEGKVIAI